MWENRLANGHVARLADKVGAFLVLNTDSHSPGDLISQDEALKVALGAGLGSRDFARMLENSREIITRGKK